MHAYNVEYQNIVWVFHFVLIEFHFIKGIVAYIMFCRWKISKWIYTFTGRDKCT